MVNGGEERFALVTGASGGIGLEIARDLAASSRFRASRERLPGPLPHRPGVRAL